LAFESLGQINKATIVAMMIIVFLAFISFSVWLELIGAGLSPPSVLLA
jgi:hypothetical protein